MQKQKSLPYVYLLTHKNTYQFYIGSRTGKKLKLPSYEDILRYKSSSKKVKELGFENFDIEILAEFFDPKDAYQFEQELIKENFKDPLCLNRNYFINGTSKFNTLGRKINFSEEHRRKLSIANKGKTLSPETRSKLSVSHKGKKISEETRLKYSKNATGENNSSSKFSNSERSDIYMLYLLGLPIKNIHKIYDKICTIGTLHKIIRKFKQNTSCNI